MPFKLLMKKEGLRVISVTSGKGGVGKTILTLNFAHAFAKEGISVMVIDGSFGNGNIDVLCGLAPDLSVRDVLSGSNRIEEVIVKATPSISILPAGTGHYGISNLDSGQKLTLLSELDRVERMADIVMIDTPPGITPDVMFLNTGATESVIVTTPEITSLMSTLSTIISLHKNFGEKELQVVVNMADDEEDASSAFGLIQEETSRYLDVNLKYLGFIPFDMDLKKSVREISPIIGERVSPETRERFKEVSRNMIDHDPEEKAKKGQQFFTRRILSEEHERETYQNTRGQR